MDRKEFLDGIKVNKNKNVSQKFSAPKGTLEKLRNKVAIALVGLTILGFSGCVKSHNNQPIEPSVSFSESTTENSYDFSSSNEVLQDFKTRYLEEYNKTNGTSISPSQIKLIESSQKTLYKTFDNQYVTHGSHPYETQKILDSYGDYTAVDTENYKLIQVLFNDEPLEYFINFFDENRNYISASVLSGNDSESLFEKLENKEGLKPTTLGKMSGLAESALDASVPYQDNDPYIKRYSKYVEELDKKNKSNEKEDTSISER